jgi:hypothetical protein
LKGTVGKVQGVNRQLEEELRKRERRENALRS